MTTIIFCPTTCWGCKFGHHTYGGHTWMDPEDLDYAGMPVPETADGWLALAKNQPCGCACAKGGGNDDP